MTSAVRRRRRRKTPPARSVDRRPPVEAAASRRRLQDEASSSSSSWHNPARRCRCHGNSYDSFVARCVLRSSLADHAGARLDCYLPSTLLIRPSLRARAPFRFIYWFVHAVSLFIGPYDRTFVCRLYKCIMQGRACNACIVCCKIKMARTISKFLFGARGEGGVRTRSSLWIKDTMRSRVYV